MLSVHSNRKQATRTPRESLTLRFSLPQWNEKMQNKKKAPKETTSASHLVVVAFVSFELPRRPRKHGSYTRLRTPERRDVLQTQIEWMSVVTILRTRGTTIHWPFIFEVPALASLVETKLTFFRVSSQRY